MNTKLAVSTPEIFSYALVGAMNGVPGNMAVHLFAEFEQEQRHPNNYQTAKNTKLRLRFELELPILHEDDSRRN
jgi:hypothetical protein